MEVERCLRVLDGAVAVFDASAGVEVKSAVIFLCVCVCNLSGKGERFSQTLCLRKGKMKFSCPIQSVSVLLWGAKQGLFSEQSTGSEHGSTTLFRVICKQKDILLRGP